MLVLNDFLNSLYDFLHFDRVLMDNLLTTIIYLVYIYICVKNGATWITTLIGYLIISTVFEFLGISSYLNVISLLNTLFTAIIDIIFTPVKNFFDAFFDIIDSITPW